MSRPALALALVLSAAVPFTASPASAQVSDPAHEVGEPLWMVGLSVFAATYVVTGATATTLVLVANARSESIAESWIPLVGPFIMLADSAGFDATQVGLTITSAILQVLGCASMIVGIVLDSQPDPTGTTSSALWLTPVVGAGNPGLGLAGTF